MKTNLRSSSHTLTHIMNGSFSLFVLFILLSPQITMVTAQPNNDSNNSNNNNNPKNPNYAEFSPSMAIIIVVLITALFFMGFFSIYVRHCADGSIPTSAALLRALSTRNRRAAAARGLEPSVIETFPTFSYSEVKHHQIGKGALECAVCLNEFEDEETLRLLPKCDHVFHPECIDAWLVAHVTCPVCRANLVTEEQVTAHGQLTSENTHSNDNLETNEEIVILQVEDDATTQQQHQEQQQQQEGTTFVKNRTIRSWSMKLFTSGKFRSHSTGHSLVQPGENLDRFTLRLPADVRKEVMDRAKLNRTRSCAVGLLPVEGSQRSSYRRMEKSDRGEGKSDRWVFFTRGFSMKSPRVVAEGSGESSGSKGSGRKTGPPVKFPSFNCLEPKGVDEKGLFAGESSHLPPV